MLAILLLWGVDAARVDAARVRLQAQSDAAFSTSKVDDVALLPWAWPIEGSGAGQDKVKKRRTQLPAARPDSGPDPLTKDDVLGLAGKVYNGESQSVVFKLSRQGSHQVVYKYKEVTAPGTFSSFLDALKECEQFVCVGVHQFKWDSVNDLGKLVPDTTKMVLVMYANEDTVSMVQRARAMGSGQSGPWPDMRNAISFALTVDGVLEATRMGQLDAESVVAKMGRNIYRNGQWSPGAQALLDRLANGDEPQPQTHTEVSLPDEPRVPGITEGDAAKMIADVYTGTLQYVIMDAGEDLVLRERHAEEAPATFKDFLYGLTNCEDRVCFGVFKLQWSYKNDLGHQKQTSQLLFVRYIDFDRVAVDLRFKALCFGGLEGPWTDFKAAQARVQEQYGLEDNQAFIAADGIKSLNYPEVVQSVDSKHYEGGFWSPSGKGLLEHLESEPGPLPAEMVDAADDEDQDNPVDETADLPWIGYLVYRESERGTLLFEWSKAEPTGALASMTPRPCLPAWEFNKRRHVLHTGVRESRKVYFSGWADFLILSWRKGSDVTLLSDTVKLYFLETGLGGDADAPVHEATKGMPIPTDPMRAAVAVQKESALYDSLVTDSIGWFTVRVRGKLQVGRAVRLDKLGAMPDYCTRATASHEHRTEEYLLEKGIVIAAPHEVESGYLGYLVEKTDADGTLRFLWSKTRPEGAIAQIYPKASLKMWEFERPMLLLGTKTKFKKNWFKAWASFLPIAMRKADAMVVLRTDIDVAVLDKSDYVHVLEPGLNIGTNFLDALAVTPASKHVFDNVHTFSPLMFVRKAREANGNAYSVNDLAFKDAVLEFANAAQDSITEVANVPDDDSSEHDVSAEE